MAKNSRIARISRRIGAKRPIFAGFAGIFEEKAMRKTHSAQLEIGAVPIENIHTGAESHDNIPAILLGLQHLYASKALRRQVFGLLESEVNPKARKDAGRPGMDLWRILGRSPAVDNVSLSGPKLLSGIGRLVVESGRKAAGKKPGEPLRGRAGSFCVETDAHYPTDADLLRDRERKRAA